MRRWVTAAFAVLGLVGSLGTSLPAADPAVQSHLPAIREQLASSDFRQREAGQRQLDQIPPAQVEILRAASRTEIDPEVKARLDERIDAMDVYNLLHPPALSLNVKNASITDVANALNMQLPATMPQIRSVGAAVGAGTFTLDLKDRPFGEILEQLNRQQNLSVRIITQMNGAAITTGLQMQVLPAGPVPAQFKAAEAFAQTLSVTGNPAIGTWAVQVMVVCDPRIRISQYSGIMQVDKITDQDGRSLAPIMLSNAGNIATMARPAPAFNSSMAFAPISGASRIKELHGKVFFTVVTGEKKVAFDMNHVPEKPIETPRGPLQIDHANGALILHYDNLTRAGPVQLLSIQMSSADGHANTSITSAGASLNLTGQLKSLGDGARLTISWFESSRECVLPVDFTDIPLPALGR